MSVPQPPASLAGSCSVISNNVLYSYSGAAFQSLALEEGAEWKELSGGESVNNGVCVGTTAALYIVGGTSGTPEYTGLQKYTYATEEWETIPLTDQITKDRVRHSATYLPASDSILVYAGGQDGGDGPSSQTFTIQASAPYGVLAFQSTISPPGVAPLLLPWSESQAAMISGNPTNLNVMLFDPATSWSDSGSTLAAPLWMNGGSPKAALVKGDDGSKHLYTFDLAASPNRVDRIMLVDGTGAPVAASAAITSRQLTADNWPDYNSTLASTITRNEFSIASDPNGMIVMSGDNDEEPVTVFDGKENGWVDAKQLFVPQEVLSAESVDSSSTSAQSSATSAASSETSSATASITSSSLIPTSTSASLTGSSATNAAETGSPAASSTLAPEPTTMPPTTILGIVLGIIFGIAIVLILLLLCLKRARNKQDAAKAREAGAAGAGAMADEKGPLPQDLPGPGVYMQGHKQQGSQGSFSSMAILMGKAQKPVLQRKESSATKRSSVSSIFNKEFKSTIGRPQYKEAPEPDFVPRNEKTTVAAAAVPRSQPNGAAKEDTMRRSSGWNRYWSGGSLNLLGFGGSNNAQRQTVTSETSHYSDTNNRMTQDSATVPPLQVETGRLELNRVNSGSPTVSQYNPRIREGVSPQIERPTSTTSSSGYSSGIPASVHESWDPNAATKPWGSDRVASSSAYSENTINFVSGLGVPNTASRPPTGVSRQPQLETAAVSSDMSWLNLGGGDNNQPQR